MEPSLYQMKRLHMQDGYGFMLHQDTSLTPFLRIQRLKGLWYVKVVNYQCFVSESCQLVNPHFPRQFTNTTESPRDTKCFIRVCNERRQRNSEEKEQWPGPCAK